MNIIPGSKTRHELQALRGEFNDLRETSKLQALIIDDITTATKIGGQRYRGNVYGDYMMTIKEIAAKYEGTAEWGVLQTGNIIDVRAAFIIGQGIAALPTDKEFKDSPEMDFVKAFFDYNDLDREMAQEFAKEAEIEGCFLGHLIWNEQDQMVSLRFQSRVDKAYTIRTEARDYAWYKQAAWNEAGSTVETIIEEPDFVYARFGGRVHLPNRPMPKIGKCLTQIESIDKALRDWREINHLFANPTPVLECKDAAEAQAMKTATTGINWKLRKILCISGKFSYVSPDLTGVREALENEIMTDAKMVSGTTGCPVGFMGFGDLTTKLGSSSDVTADLISASTSKERSIWIGKYTEIVTKAMAIYNANSKMTPLDPTRVKVIIPQVTAETWKRVMDVYLPLFTAQAIDLSTLLSQVPNIDVDAEVAKQEEKDAAALNKFTDQPTPDENADPNAPDQGGPGNLGNLNIQVKNYKKNPGNQGA
jgi:hypothetical protein